MFQVRPALAVSLLVGLSAPTAAHAYCAGWDTTAPDYDPTYYSAKTEFGRAIWVVTARVVSETWLDDDGRPAPLKPPFQHGGALPGGFDPYMGAFYEVEVLNAFKGAPPKRLSLFSENTTARFHLVKGREYLLFVSEETFDPPVGRQLTLDTCGNSDLKTRASRALAEVKRIAPPQTTR